MFPENLLWPRESTRMYTALVALHARRRPQGKWGCSAPARPRLAHATAGCAQLTLPSRARRMQQMRTGRLNWTSAKEAGAAMLPRGQRAALAKPQG